MRVFLWGSCHLTPAFVIIPDRTLNTKCIVGWAFTHFVITSFLFVFKPQVQNNSWIIVKLTLLCEQHWPFLAWKATLGPMTKISVGHTSKCSLWLHLLGFLRLLCSRNQSSFTYFLDFIPSTKKTCFMFPTSVSVSAYWLSSIMNHSTCVGQSPNVPIISTVASSHTSQLYLCLLINCQSVLSGFFCYLITLIIFGRLSSLWRNWAQKTTTVWVSSRIKAFYSRKQPPLILLVWSTALSFCLREGILSERSINRRKCQLYVKHIKSAVWKITSV